ncbi:735_t:CDS:10 [Funneliformis caledonium]|uniref:735_t:CDS:1 n=1 Tax=Funneliformis caledonium TaxID=1117310 RepID=A0A9N9B529_9GLOM|nr:735_t:CDS:10 [Funneliformis caledonium]
MSQWITPGSFQQQPPYSSFPAPPIDDLSLAFDNLAMALRATAGPPEIDNFQISLGMLMHDCSQSNIQRGKTWIFDHCTTPAHFDTLICFIIALSKSRPIFEDRLHLIYLINDVLFHSERRQEPWIKEALHPHLLALLRVAFHFMDANEKQKEKVVKIISIWDDKQYFDDNKINALRTGIIIPPPPSSGISSLSYSNPGQHSIGHLRYQGQQPYYNSGVPPPPPPPTGIFPAPQPTAQSISPPVAHLSPPIAQSLIRPASEPVPAVIPEQFPPGPSPPSMPMQGIIRSSIPTTPIPSVSEKKYYELPAGLMVPAVLPEDSPYTPIHAASIRLPPHRLPPTTELLEAVDRFYEGMFIIESNLEGEDERALKEKYQIDLDKDGWEIGFLDDFYMDLQEQREEALARASSDRHHQQQQHVSSFRNRRDDRGIEVAVVQVVQEVAGGIDIEWIAGVLVVAVRGIEAIVGQDIAGRGLVQELAHLLGPGQELEQGQDQGLDQKLGLELYSSRSRSRSRSRSYDRSYNSHDRRKSSDYSSSSRRRYRSRSYNQEVARADKMISDRNVGFQMLKKLGWEGAGTGLGSTSTGIAEPIKGGELRFGEQKYLGVGHSRGEDGDIFDQYRKSKSYTYQRSEICSKDKKPAGCFRCGKHGHLARDCSE